MKILNQIRENLSDFDRFAGGIDVHKEFSIVSIYSSKKESGIEYTYEKTDRFQMIPQGLAEMVSYLSKYSNLVVAFESTGPYSLLVYKVLQDHMPQEKVLCVNAYFAKALPGRKSDKLDSKNLAKYAFYGLLKGSYIPDNTYQILRRLTRSRKRLVRMAASSKNRIIMILDRAGLRINTEIDLFAKYGLQLLLELAMGTSLKHYIEICPPNSHILQYKAYLTPFCSLELLVFEREELQAALLEYCFLVKQVAETERALYNFMNQPGNESLLAQFNILVSVPSIGDISAFELLAELGPITRFTSLKRAQSYTGLVPTLVESGGKEKKKKLLKRGNRRLRTTLVQCAKTLVYLTKNISPEFRAYINSVVQKNTPIEKKIWVEIAKKLLRICMALLRSGRSFDSLVIEKVKRRKWKRKQKNERGNSISSKSKSPSYVLNLILPLLL